MQPFGDRMPMCSSFGMCTMSFSSFTSTARATSVKQRLCLLVTTESRFEHLYCGQCLKWVGIFIHTDATDTPEQQQSTFAQTGSSPLPHIVFCCVYRPTPSHSLPTQSLLQSLRPSRFCSQPACQWGVTFVRAVSTMRRLTPCSSSGSSCSVTRGR